MTGNGAVFASTSEAFEWTGTNLHWQGLRFVFDNSNAIRNEVQDQLVNSAGLTDLTDGQCIYVDVDRSTTRTVALVNALVAQKGTLQTLGGSTTPGQRFVIAYRSGSNVYVRDQPFPVGTSFHQAAVGSSGAVRVSSAADASWTPASIPVVPTIAMKSSQSFAATCGGISHNLDLSLSQLITAGDIVIGRGSAAGDNNIQIVTSGDNGINLTTNNDTNNAHVYVRGRSSFPSYGAFNVSLNADGSGAYPYSNAIVMQVNAQHEAGQGVTGSGDSELFSIESSNAIRIGTAVVQPTFSGTTYAGGFAAWTKIYVKPSLFWRAPCRLSTTVALPTYTATSGPGVGRTLTANANGALSVDSVAVAVNDRILVTAAASAPDNGIYAVTQAGSAGTPWILVRAVDNDDGFKCCHNMAVRITAGTIRTGFNYAVTTANPIFPGITTVTFSTLTSGTPGRATTDSVVLQWWDGTETVLGTSPTYTGSM
jgi:hypothetical protein